MNKNKKLFGFLGLVLVAVALLVTNNFFFKERVIVPIVETPVVSTSSANIYKNDTFGFQMTLSKDWAGYTASTSEVKFGNSITLRHPLWTKENPRMDIPVLIYSVEQWGKWLKTDFEGYPTAAPIGPTERGHNDRYVFATAPRYNFSFLTGFEQVEEILKTLVGY